MSSRKTVGQFFPIANSNSRSGQTMFWMLSTISLRTVRCGLSSGTAANSRFSQRMTLKASTKSVLTVHTCH